MAKAIKSVLTQTFSEFEIIIVDDASTDNSENIISSFNDDRIVYIRNQKNIERCKSRNKGIKIAQGKYICFLDSDDYHLPNHLEQLYKTIQAKGEPQALLFTNAWNETGGKRTERICPPIEKYNLFHYIVTYTFNPQRMCIHKDICKDFLFDPEVYVCEDLDYAANIATKYPVIQVNKRTTIYVHHSESFTSGDKEKPFKELENYKRIFHKKELRKKIPLFSRWRLISMCHFHIAQLYYEQKKYWNMYKSIIISFFLCPIGYNKKTIKIMAYMSIKSILKLFVQK